MKNIFSLLFVFLFSISSAFAFMPAESSSSSESKATVAKKEVKKAEATKTITSKELKAKFEANKKNMSFKERLAAKLITKKLAKAEKKQAKLAKKGIKSPDATAMDGGLATLFKILGLVFIVVGVIAIIASLNVFAGLGSILIGILFFLLPSIV